jgi:hypothetical protein
VGEALTSPHAILNAINNACGARITVPALPEVVKAAIEKARDEVSRPTSDTRSPRWICPLHLAASRNFTRVTRRHRLAVRAARHQP